MHSFSFVCFFSPFFTAVLYVSFLFGPIKKSWARNFKNCLLSTKCFGEKKKIVLEHAKMAFTANDVILQNVQTFFAHWRWCCLFFFSLISLQCFTAHPYNLYISFFYLKTIYFCLSTSYCTENYLFCYVFTFHCNMMIISFIFYFHLSLSPKELSLFSSQFFCFCHLIWCACSSFSIVKIEKKNFFDTHTHRHTLAGRNNTGCVYCRKNR